MSSNDINVGDKVTIKDGSYAVRVDKYEEYSSIGLCKDIFEVIQVSSSWKSITCTVDLPVHNIVIKNTVTGKMYLHSASDALPISLS